MNNVVITIGRQYGSGGREIGEKLAKELNIPFYDKELVEMAAKKSDISAEVFQQVDEKATNSFLYSLVTGNSMRGINSPVYYEMPINDKLFIAQADIIKNVAREGSCVIVGRCADYILEDIDVPTLNVFIYASLEKRIERISRIYELTSSKAKDAINKTEKRRRTYYNYYSSQEWGKMTNYDLCISTDTVGSDGAVQLIKRAVELRK